MFRRTFLKFAAVAVVVPALNWLPRRQSDIRSTTFVEMVQGRMKELRSAMVENLESVLWSPVDGDRCQTIEIDWAIKVDGPRRPHGILT